MGSPGEPQGLSPGERAAACHAHRMRAVVLVMLLMAACEPLDEGDEPIDAGTIDDDAGSPTDAGVNACVVFDRAEPQTRIGSIECPLLDDGTQCPRACAEIRAIRFDAERCCQALPSELIACVEPLIPFPGAVNCFVRFDGVAYLATGPIIEPFFAGWRACTEAERNIALSAELCP